MILSPELHSQLINNAIAKSLNRHMAIDFSSECQVGCKFCFNSNDIPGTVKIIPKITEEILDNLLTLIQKENPSIRVVQIGSGDKIWWGDPMAHPDFIRFLTRIANALPNAEIHFDTTGYYATDDIINGLIQLQNKVKVYLSVNTFNNTLRRQYLTHPGIAGLKAMLENVIIDFAYLKHFGDAKVAIEDISMLLGYSTVKYICYYKLHYTKYNNAIFSEQIKMTQNNFYPTMERIYNEFPFLKLKIHAETQWLDNDIDKESAIYEGNITFIDNISKIIDKLYPQRNFVLCSGESSYPYMLSRFGFDNAIAIPNKSYGGSITSSGLLTLSDIIASINTNKIRSNYHYIIPSETIDEAGYDRQGISFNSIYNEIQKKGGVLIDLKMIPYFY